MQNGQTASNFLRPEFTEKVAGWLNEGRAVNLYAPKGQGMRRLVDDLARLRPENVCMVRVNMNTCAYAVKAFSTALADGMGIALNGETNYRILVNRYLEDHPKQRIWLCLERFDALAEVQVEGSNVDGVGYDLDFLNFLNSLKNREAIGLLVCSLRPVRVRELYIAGRAVSGSKLEFSLKEALPGLRTDEIQRELLRCCQGLSADSNCIAELVLAVYKHKSPADFLDFLCAKPIDSAQAPADCRKQVAAWKAEFAKENKPSCDKIIGALERSTHRWAIRLGRVLDLLRVWRNMGKTAKIAWTTTAAAALALWQWGEKLLALLNAWLNP